MAPRAGSKPQRENHGQACHSVGRSAQRRQALADDPLVRRQSCRLLPPRLVRRPPAALLRAAPEPRSLRALPPGGRRTGVREESHSLFRPRAPPCLLPLAGFAELCWLRSLRSVADKAAPSLTPALAVPDERQQQMPRSSPSLPAVPRFPSLPDRTVASRPTTMPRLPPARPCKPPRCATAAPTRSDLRSETRLP
jgi:hypothetical protein